MLTTLRAAALAVATTVAFSQAQAETITWGDEDFTGVTNVYSNNSFDEGYITFDGFETDTLTEISGTGFYNNHNKTAENTYTLSILLDGIWTAIYEHTYGGQGFGDYFLADIGAISFTSGIVSGLRWSSVNEQIYVYHEMRDTDYTFAVSSVPLPAGAPLLLVGLAGFGVLRRRANRAA